MSRCDREGPLGAVRCVTFYRIVFLNVHAPIAKPTVKPSSLANL